MRPGCFTGTVSVREAARPGGGWRRLRTPRVCSAPPNDGPDGGQRGSFVPWAHGLKMGRGRRDAGTRCSVDERRKPHAEGHEPVTDDQAPSDRSRARTRGGGQSPGGGPQAAPLTLTLRLPRHLPPARTYGTRCPPARPQRCPRQGAQRDCVGQDRTPRLLASPLPDCPRVRHPPWPHQGHWGLVRCRLRHRRLRPQGCLQPHGRPRARP